MAAARLGTSERAGRRANGWALLTKPSRLSLSLS